MNEESRMKLYWIVEDEALHPALCLALKSHGLAEQVHIVAGQDGVMDGALTYRAQSAVHYFGQDLDRIRTILEKHNAPQLLVGEFILKPEDRALIRQDKTNERIILTDRETDIVLHLALAQGQSISREQLLRNVWGYNDQVETHTLETHIYRLRQKIEIDPASPKILLTTDAGYCLNIL